MKIETTCKECSNKISREIQIGDIVYPCDGSSMCSSLHHRLIITDTRSKDRYWWVHGFEAVRVLAIEGNLLGVQPIDWKLDYNCPEDDRLRASKSQLYGGETCQNFGEGFWIYAGHVRAEKQNRPAPPRGMYDYHC